MRVEVFTMDEVSIIMYDLITSYLTCICVLVGKSPRLAHFEVCGQPRGRPYLGPAHWL